MLEHSHFLIVFSILVIGLLTLDLFVVGRNPHKISLKEAGIWTTVFIAVAILFGIFVVGPDLGAQAQTEYFTAYVIEKMLSVDNLFVFILVFGYFKVPAEYQHKVLFWGVLGAIIMRLVFIFLGVGFIGMLDFTIAGHSVNIVLLLFGLFLAYTGVKTLIEEFGSGDKDEEQDFSKSPGARMIRYFFPRVTEKYHGDKFFIKQEEDIYGDTLLESPKTTLHEKIGSRLVTYATPLLIVVGVIEFTDLLFAVDSIPAIFAVSKDPFVLYASNIFAILGLRSMYFLLAGLLPMFKHLGKGVSLILLFIGAKMVIAPWLHIQSDISLYAILGVLTVSVVASLLTYKPENNV